MFGCCIVADTLTYTITSGNTGNVFGIKSKTGDIYVAKDLDFETPPNVRSLFIFNLKILCIVVKAKWIPKAIFFWFHHNYIHTKLFSIMVIHILLFIDNDVLCDWNQMFNIIIFIAVQAEYYCQWWLPQQLYRSQDQGERHQWQHPRVFPVWVHCHQHSRGISTPSWRAVPDSGQMLTTI